MTEKTILCLTCRNAYKNGAYTATSIGSEFEYLIIPDDIIDTCYYSKHLCYRCPHYTPKDETSKNPRGGDWN